LQKPSLVWQLRWLFKGTAIFRAMQRQLRAEADIRGHQ